VNPGGRFDLLLLAIVALAMPALSAHAGIAVKVN
jgi:hypothetical protein